MQALAHEQPYSISSCNDASLKRRAPEQIEADLLSSNGSFSKYPAKRRTPAAPSMMPAPVTTADPDGRGRRCERVSAAGQAPLATGQRVRHGRPAACDEATDLLLRRIAELEEERSKLLLCCSSMAALYAEMSRKQAEMTRVQVEMAYSNATVARAHAELAERAAPLFQQLMGDRAGGQAAPQQPGRPWPTSGARAFATGDGSDMIGLLDGA